VGGLASEISLCAMLASSDVKWFFTGKKSFVTGKKTDSFLTADR